MITLNTNSRNILPFSRKFLEEFNLNTNEKFKPYTQSFNRDLGKGEVNCTLLNNTITYIEYNVNFTEDVTIGKTMIKPNYIYFIYGLKGTLNYKDSNYAENKEIREFRTCIYSSDIPSEALLTFKKDTDYKISIIAVQKENQQNHVPSMTNEVVNFFKQNGDNSRRFIHIGSFNLRIAEKLDALNQIKATDLEKTLEFQGLLHVILSMQLKQYSEDLEFQKNRTGSLTIREIKSAKAISDKIKSNPQIQICINDMCRESGLSPCKLQEAFKLLHNKTANDFIRNERLRMAEKLICKNQLNISEIVYSIGLSSRSYFSRIFKEKYGCTPKSYQDNFGSYTASAV